MEIFKLIWVRILKHNQKFFTPFLFRLYTDKEPGGKSVKEL
jgi:hypothetical protein